MKEINELLLELVSKNNKVEIPPTALFLEPTGKIYDENIPITNQKLRMNNTKHISRIITIDLIKNGYL